MPTPKTDYLVQLINSLTKAEKRSFRLFVTRNQTSDDILFLKLFDEMSRIGRFDEAQVLERIPAIKKRQLSNLKAHLYKQLLICLRLLSRPSITEIDIREKIDYARVLYDKGLYRQSLEILSRTKATALKSNQYILALNVLEFEKFIESQYITRSIESRAEELKKEAVLLTKKIERTQAFSNLALQLYGLYLKVGHVRNKHDFQYLHDFFHSNLPEYDMDQLDFHEKLFLFQSYGWYHYMNQDFVNFYRYTRSWYDLFEEYPDMVFEETALYLKSIHNVLTSLFITLSDERFSSMLAILEGIPERGLIRNLNHEGLFKLYHYIHLVNKHFLEGSFSEGVKAMPELVALIKENPYDWDTHRILVFYYKIACMYFGSGDWSSSITYLNKIINAKNPDFRGDILSFARILNLIAHYELGNQVLLEYQIKSVYRYLGKMRELQDVQNEIFRFLRKTTKMSKGDLRVRFQQLHSKLLRLMESPYAKRAFLYLDIMSWLESKLENTTVEKVVRRGYLKRVGKEASSSDGALR
ncbi:MAG: hypothetical protein HKN76_13385 [Saprospiraceae bacterium]|nr:hypothetical protein [Saprospiraceae bacterium]